jgi:hypothetical protein
VTDTSSHLISHYDGITNVKIKLRAREGQQTQYICSLIQQDKLGLDAESYFSGNNCSDSYNKLQLE